MRSILLNPGPVSLSEGVRRAATEIDLCHREAEFFALQDRVRSALLGVYKLVPEQWLAVTLGGSGTTALEAMMASLLPRDGRLLVLENGFYGERLSRLADIYGIARESLAHGWQAAWNIEAVAAALDSGRFTHVAAVHHETTTGRLNPADVLTRLCERYGAGLLLDTVSSFAAESIPFDSPALQACAVTANKCLHGITGLCIVLVRPAALALAVDPPRTLTLDLALWADHQRRQSTPFTPSVNALMALDQALLELAQAGGWSARHARYHKLAGGVARQLLDLGVDPLLAAADSSCVLRAYRIPPGRSYDSVHAGLKQRGFVVYAGQGSLASQIFRISTMGDISDYDMGRLGLALDCVFS